MKEAAMEFNSLPLFYITSKIKGLVKINQNPTGETGHSPVVTPFSSKSGFVLTFEPIENKDGKLYLPFTRKIEITGEEISFSEDGLIKQCTWPENIYSFDLYPLYIEYANSSFAKVLSDFSFYISGVSHNVFVYEEMSYYIGIENSNTGRLVFACSIDFMVSSASISLYKNSESPYLIIRGETKQSEDYIIVVAIKPSFKIVFMKSCKHVYIEGSKIVLDEQIDLNDIIIKREYLIADNKVSLSNNISNVIGESSQHKIVNFVELVRVKSQALLEMLSTSLKNETSYGDIIEYFGDFHDYEKPISSLTTKKNQVALKYQVSENKQLARVFAFDFKKQNGTQVIDNIYEPS